MTRARLTIYLFLIALGLLFALLAPLSGLVLLTDGALPVVLLLGAAGWGAWPAAWLGHGCRPVGQQALIATALGLGVVGVACLTFGVAGRLSWWTAWGLVTAGGVCGLVRLYAAQGERGGEHTETHANSGPERPALHGSALLRLLPMVAGLLLLVPAFVGLFAATLPPGTVWEGEARGYDVLEYHLQTPREYFEAGRISFLPHNVYASFPQQVEVLYLLLMHLTGDAYAAAIPAQLLHALLGALALAVLCLWTTAGSARWVVALVAGTTPWLAYLGSLAYVECGLLFFAAVATVLVVEWVQAAAAGGWRQAAAAGLCAGLAAGCKYTALVLVVVGLLIAALVAARAGWRRRAAFAVVFGVAAAVAVGPWLVRNAAFTRNPVYPFAYSWFGGEAWSAEQAEQWRVGHRVPTEHGGVGGRLALAFGELVGRGDGGSVAWRPGLFGVGLLAVGLLGLAVARSRVAVLLAAWTGVMLLAWGAMTHMPGRFVVPIVIPLALAVGRAVMRPRVGVVFVVLSLIVAATNGAQLVSLVRSHSAFWSRLGVSMVSLAGATDGFAAAQPLNAILPEDTYTWLVGDAAVYYIDRRVHYTVVFSRDPWIAFAAGEAAEGAAMVAAPTAAQCVDWLRERSVTHVVFNWPEIERLRRTYGFSPQVTRAWVAELSATGLRQIDVGGGPAGIAIYEVVRGDEALAQ